MLAAAVVVLKVLAVLVRVLAETVVVAQERQETLYLQRELLTLVVERVVEEIPVAQLPVVLAQMVVQELSSFVILVLKKVLAVQSHQQADIHITPLRLQVHTPHKVNQCHQRLTPIMDQYLEVLV
jgi:hypothetical protein